MTEITVTTRVTRCGVRAFEGIGRPFEGWVFRDYGWASAGRAFTRAGAAAKAYALGCHLAGLQAQADYEAGDRIVELARKVGVGAPEGTEATMEKWRRAREEAPSNTVTGPDGVDYYRDAAGPGGAA